MTKWTEIGPKDFERKHNEYKELANKVAKKGEVKLLDITYGTTINSLIKTVKILIPGVEGHPQNFSFMYLEGSSTYQNLQEAQPITMIKVEFKDFGGQTDTGFTPASGVSDFLTFSKI